MKCIEDEIPFQLPKGWAWSRLETITSVITDYVANGSFASLKENVKTYKEKNYALFVRTVDFANNFQKDLSYIDKESYDFLEKSKLFGGELMLSNIGASIGKVFKVPYFDIPMSLAPNSIILRFFDDITSDYFEFVFKSFVGQNYLQYLSGGAAMPKFNKTDLRAMIVPLAPLNEQNRMVISTKNCFSIVDEIETSQTGLSNIISVVKSKILDLAIRGQLVPQDPNDEPASVLLERIRAEKEELIKAGKIKRDKKESVIFKGDDNSYYRSVGKCTERCEDLPSDLPKGWQWTSLGQYCEKVTDQVASGSFAALRENVLSLKEPNYAIMVKTADFSNNFTKNLTYTDKRGYKFLENSNLFGGELILSNIGSIGKVFIVPDLKTKMTLAPNSVMIRLINNECKDYLYYFLLSPTGYAELKAISTGVAMLKFNKTDLKTIYFPLPPLAEQKRIVEAIENIFAHLDEISNAIA